MARPTAEDFPENAFLSGPFTPYFYGASVAGTGVTYAANYQSGRFQMMADWCQFSINLKLSSKGSPAMSGSLRVGGLPFPVATDTYEAYPLAIGVLTGLTMPASHLQALARVVNGDYIELSALKNDATRTLLTVADVSAAFELQVSGMYRVG